MSCSLVVFKNYGRVLAKRYTNVTHTISHQRRRDSKTFIAKVAVFEPDSDLGTGGYSAVADKTV